MRLKHHVGALIVALLAVCMVFVAYGTPAIAQPTIARPSTTGALHVEGSQLVDDAGQAVELCGVSTHGLQWFPQYVNQELFGQLSEEWNCNLVRLALYSKDYCEGSKKIKTICCKRSMRASMPPLPQTST